jgi:ectoine hydroxylase-related dioxygenase (phytanoyl-CoA dioxygenase family)
MSMQTDAATSAPKAAGPRGLVALARDASVEEIIGTLERDGAVIVRDFLGPSTVDALNSDFEPHIQARALGSWEHPNDRIAKGGSFAGKMTKRIGGLAAKSSNFVSLICHPTFLACADHFLKPNCGSYYLNGSQLMVVGPGSTEQLLHRDEGDWPHFPAPKPELTINWMVALSDFTAANGATRLVVGSHLWNKCDMTAANSSVTQAVMPAGSVLFYTGKILHGAGANRTTDQWRKGMWFAYCLGWLRQYENQFLASPPAVARNFPKLAQELLGYRTHNPAPRPGGVIGGVDTGIAGVNDPARVLE